MYYLALVGAMVGIVVLGIIVLKQLLFTVPANHFALMKRFDGYTGDVFEEGLHWKIPFIDSFELEERKLETAQFKMKVQSTDGLEVEVVGSIQYRADRNNLITWARIADATIAHGLIDKVESVLTEVIGENKADSFVKRKKAIERMINAILRMREADWPHTAESDPEKYLDYYKSELVDAGKSRSEVEEQYGITIEVVAVTDFTFDAEVEKLRAKKTRNTLNVEAAEVISSATLENMKKLQAEGNLSPQDSMTMTNQVFGIAVETGQRVLTVQQDSGRGVIPVLHLDEDKIARPEQKRDRK